MGLFQLVFGSSGACVDCAHRDGGRCERYTEWDNVNGRTYMSCRDARNGPCGGSGFKRIKPPSYSGSRERRSGEGADGSGW